MLLSELKVEIKVVDFGSLKALATVILDGMEIRGLKVIESETGLWVGMPSKDIIRDGKKEYFDIIRFRDPEAKKAFCDQIIKAYEKAR